tara:strand:- start:177 stop:749 length:573 start_codon:yes stop_codon:yes gene_type:complete
MISLLCSSRSGSTSLSLYLSKILDLKLETLPFIKEREISSLEDGIFYKILIHQQAKGYDSLFDFGEQIILKSDKIILLDRENKLEQSESLAFRKSKYGDDFSKYHIREPYGNIDVNLINECMFHYKEHSRALSQLSKKHNIPLFTYEEIYLNKRIDRLNEYLGIDRNENLENLYINNNRDRVINLKETMI